MTGAASCNPNTLRFLRLRDVCKRTALSKSTLYNYIAQDRFPAAVRLGARAVGWREDEINRWCSDPTGWTSE
ncbi:helix-turn-helix transcriptional regulator [Thiohalomonas denitrificans]|uniref:Transcriptional regulator, AlpA family n=1 Tax=Thiohalomonas denitrificans TaxID=415747 RepID=A0A1G5PU49_9GAMM|nr:AlpA family transcriptional regulator [Thiohalomonas denitrificans]SCZ52938.1 transcriptional regulator, AlpA family [Thiohalomonas denitrificans]